MKRFAFCHKVNPGSLLRFGALPPAGWGGAGEGSNCSDLGAQPPPPVCALSDFWVVSRSA